MLTGKAFFTLEDMEPEAIFELANLIALISWVILLLLPFQKIATNFVFGIVITILAITYAFIVMKSIGPGDFESFNTLEGVMGLFTAKEAVLAGWLHYLAFDLMVGLYIVNNAFKHDIKHWLLIPSLLFTFMLGPVGLLIYKLTKGIINRKIGSYY